MLLKTLLITCFFFLNSYSVEYDNYEDTGDVEETIKTEIRIGALFDKEDEILTKTFISAVDIINNDEELLSNMTLIPILLDGLSQHDSLEAEEKVCELVSYGVAAIFGPQSPFTSYHVQSLCDTMEMPHLSTKWDLSQRRSSCLLNIYPHPSSLAQAITDIVTAWDWRGFTVIYDDFDALKKIQGIIKLADDKGYLVVVRQLESDDGNYRKMLKEIKYSDETNIVIECAVDKLYNLLVQAHQVGLLGSRYSYIITTLDFQTINYKPFMWGGTNITGIRLVDPDDPYVRNATQIEAGKKNGVESITISLNDISTTESPMDEEEEDTSVIPTVEAALLHDSVKLFVKALEHLSPLNIKPLECGSGASLDYGYTVINYMRLSEIKGMTGIIKFDHEGFRTDIQLDVISLREEGLKKVGMWNATTGLVMDPPEPTVGPIYDNGDDLRNKTFIVIIALTHPYNMLKEDSKTLTGNDRYEGFGVDLIHELSLMSGFNYTFVVQHNKNSGSPTTLKNGSRVWDGMIGEIQAGRADLAIADISITRERERDFDFTHPFMNLVGISILHRKPSKAAPDLFSFLAPFSNDVWGCMLGAYFGVSLLLFVMARLSPNEWTNPYPCIEEPDHLENQFSFLNSLWFTLGSVMQQGSDVAPISVSTRLVAAIWWFFTLIMVSSYTANLAACLTVENNFSPFTNVKELVEQTEIKYGAKLDGSTAHFFRDSKEELYQKIHKYMMAHPELMVIDNEAGVNRVVNDEKYAFFSESVSIEYEVQRKCNLAMIGDLLDNKGYGIVMRQNSSYRNVLNKDVVRLSESGKLTQLKDKWWKEKRGGGACNSGTKETEAEELDLRNVGGVFLVLVSGCLIGVFLSLLEILWDIAQREDKISFKDELLEEIKFIARCRGTVKPVKKSSLAFAESNNLSKSSSKSSNTSKGSSKNSFSFRLP